MTTTPRTLFLLPLLLAALAGCRDRLLPTAAAPEGAVFSQMAASPVVNSLLDDVVPTEADAGCTAAKCTLRSAIAFAAPGAEITFSGVNGTITLMHGGLHIAKDVTITGPGAASLTVNGSGAHAVFHIGPPATVSVSGLTITGAGSGIDNEGGVLTVTHSVISGNIYTGIVNGWSPPPSFVLGTLTLAHSTVSENGTLGVSEGGGIGNLGEMTVLHSIISRNRAFLGGGINTRGRMTLAHSEVSDNEAEDAGGGIQNMGTLEVAYSTISDNRGFYGGGIWAEGGDLTFTNTTISRNASGWAGGGIFVDGAVVTLTHSTVWGNSAPSGGGIFSPYTWGPIRLRNTIVAGSPSGGNCLGIAGSIIDDGYNLDDGTSCGFSGSSLSGTDPLLGALQLHAPGTTKTHVLQPGSPAINAGTCTDHTRATVATDQRGVGRPQGGACDIGAFEVGFTFSGFFAPVENLPTVNVAKAGSAIPVKFSLGGDYGLSIFASGSPGSQPITCEAGAPEGPIGSTVSAGGSSLSYDALTDTYTYVWKTEKGWANSCRKLTLVFEDDPTKTPYAAEFRFTK